MAISLLELGVVSNALALVLVSAEMLTATFQGFMLAVPVPLRFLAGIAATTKKDGLKLPVAIVASATIRVVVEQME